MKHVGSEANLNATNSTAPKRRKFWLTLSFLAFWAASLSPAPELPDLSDFARHGQNPVKRVLASLAERRPNFTPSPQPPPEGAYPALPEFLPPAPALGESEHLRRLRSHDVLKDPMDRVSDDFDIPAELNQRVKFWFDVYTKYGRFTHVLHHSRYPWIVYEVIDFTDAVKSGKGPEWLKVEKSKKLLRQRRAEIRLALRRLSRRPAVAKTDLEKRLVSLLASVPGRRSHVYRDAAGALRSQLGQRDYFIAGLRRSSRYLPHLEETFLSQGLPLGLTRMPFVESSFNERAESKVGASGIWQVMPATGRAYGLVNGSIDERNSPFKATAMAARLLKTYHKALGSWPLAITAYNHGIGNIQIAIRAARSRDLPKIIERYHQRDFKFASSNFYTCFLAALYAERYSEVVFPSVVRDPAISHDRFMVTRSVPLKQLITFGDLNLNKVLEFNLDINRRAWRQVTLPRGFVLHLPRGHGDLLPERLRSKMRPVPSSPTTITDTRERSKPSI
jgi:membrane-bound lytic murein transglycosylase D